MQKRLIIAILLCLLAAAPVSLVLGDAALTIDPAAQGAAPTPAIAEDPQPIRANTPTIVTLTGTAPFDLLYTAAGDDTISVIARSMEEPGVVDTTVEVLTTSGTRLSFNDDHGGARSGLQAFDSVIEDLELPRAGDYVIRVTTFSGAGAGDVEVTVESDDADPGTTAEEVPSVVNPDASQLPNNAPAEGEPGATAKSETITGTLEAEGTYTHTFAATAGDVVTITVRAPSGSGLDPQVTLIGTDGDELAYNDDHDDTDSSLSSFDARILNFSLPETGDYTIEITGFLRTSGAFELTIDSNTGIVINAPSTTNTPSAENDEEADIVEGQIGPNEPYVYALDAEMGDVYTLTARATSGNLDPQLYVYDPAGNFVLGSDDHGTSDRTLAFLDAQIENFIVPDDGEYTVEVYGYGDTTGRFELTVTKVATNAPTGAPEEEVVTGQIEPGGEFTTTFEAEPGEYVTISVRGLSAELDPQAALLGPNGRVVADNDDHGTVAMGLGQYDSRIENYRVTEAGEYTVRVTGYGETEGTFAVTISVLR